MHNALRPVHAASFRIRIEIRVRRIPWVLRSRRSFVSGRILRIQGESREERDQCENRVEQPLHTASGTRFDLGAFSSGERGEKRSRDMNAFALLTAVLLGMPE